MPRFYTPLVFRQTLDSHRTIEILICNYFANYLELYLNRVSFAFMNTREVIDAIYSGKIPRKEYADIIRIIFTRLSSDFYAETNAMPSAKQRRTLDALLLIADDLETFYERN